MAALGKDGSDPTPGAGKGDPVPEWAYHPGKAARSMPAAASFGAKVMGLPPAWRKIALDDAQQRSVNWFADWPAFVSRVEAEIAAGATRPQGAATPLGFLPAGVIDTLATGQAMNGRTFDPVVPRTALVSAADRGVYHALRDAKFNDRPELRQAFGDAMRGAHEWVASADAVLWDPRKRVLLFARRDENGRYKTLVTRVDLRERRARDPAIATWMRTVETYTVAALRQYSLVAGVLE